MNRLKLLGLFALALLPNLTWAADGPVPIINFELIADSSTIFSADGGKFKDFPTAPVVDGESVFFVATRENGLTGIFRNRLGITDMLVSSKAEIPDGVGKFSSFDGAPMGSGEQLVFRGVGGNGQQGIYYYADGKLSKIVDTNTLMPNAKKKFESFKRPVFDGKTVVFVGRGYVKADDNSRKYQGAYQYDIATKKLAVVADWTTKVPDKSVLFGDMDDITVSRDRVILTASDEKDNTGIYSSQNGNLTALIDHSTALPNSPDKKFTGLNDGAVERSFKNNNFAFKTASKDNKQNGIHAWIDGKLFTMADNKAEMAGGSVSFSGFSKPNIYNDRVFFIGKNPQGLSSIYAWKNGGRFPIIHPDILLSGKKPKDFNLSLESASSNSLSFMVTFDDGSKAIYKAHLRDEVGKVVLLDTLHGKSNGQAQGGQFVDGGGWTLLHDNDRIVWNVPPMSSHGLLEVDVRNFDPKTQLTANKNIFLGLWGTLFSNHERMNLPDTDNWELRVGKAHPQFKIEYHARGFGKAKEWVPFDGSFDPKHTYRIRFEWNNGRVSTWVDDKVLHFEGLSYEPVDHFNFLHIGTSSHFNGTGTVGPIYSNVRIVSFE
jgi:hypothetical protein